MTEEEINAPMGMEKKARIQALLSCPSGDRQWNERYGANWTEEDVECLYEKFEGLLYQMVAEYSVPIPGVVETVRQLREKGLKIGSTTDYTSQMMGQVLPRAAELTQRKQKAAERYTEAGADLVIDSIRNLPAFVSLSNVGFTIRGQVFRASNPTVEQFFEIYQTTRDFAPEAVVTVGGRSIMDVGKSLFCLYGKELSDADALRWLIDEKDYGLPSTRWIDVPTTAGTGSEVTCWATIWDTERDSKRSVECRENYAFAALVDPELAAGMPLMLVCLGMGPEVGMAGLCVHTTAFFTKSFSQSFESIPDETIEALEVTGASHL